MRLKANTFENISKKVVDDDKRIIIYGAGMIGSVTTLSILKEFNLLPRIDCFIDGDLSKCGTKILNIPVYSKEKLRSIDAEKYILFIAISRFYDLLEELNSYDNLNNVDCYIVPMLCIDNYKTSSEVIVDKYSNVPVIPKVINYMWLGKNSLPNALQKCIDSWKKFCPDYEIKCWNEDNYDINKIPYMKQAYEAKVYGFVPDYARLDILYNYGGLYFDTDVQLIRNIDELLYQEAFCCVEKWQTINFGGGSGAVPKNMMIGKLLKERERICFAEADGRLNRNTCGYYDTVFFQKYGYKINGKMQKINGVTVYPYEVFHPYDYMSGRVEKTINTYGIHYFNGGWLDDSQANANRITVQNYEEVKAKVVKE